MINSRSSTVRSLLQSVKLDQCPWNPPMNDSFLHNHNPLIQPLHAESIITTIIFRDLSNKNSWKGMDLLIYTLIGFSILQHTPFNPKLRWLHGELKPWIEMIRWYLTQFGYQTAWSLKIHGFLLDFSLHFSTRFLATQWSPLLGTIFDLIIVTCDW